MSMSMMTTRRIAMIAASAGFSLVASVVVWGAAPGPQQTATATPASAGAARTEPKAPPDFVRDVLPIIESHCLRCHSAAVQKGGLVMDTHEDLMQGGEKGVVITPGNSGDSRLIKMVQGE